MNQRIIHQNHQRLRQRPRVTVRENSFGNLIFQLDRRLAYRRSHDQSHLLDRFPQIEGTPLITRLIDGDLPEIADQFCGTLQVPLEYARRFAQGVNKGLQRRASQPGLQLAIDLPVVIE